MMSIDMTTWDVKHLKNINFSVTYSYSLIVNCKILQKLIDGNCKIGPCDIEVVDPENLTKEQEMQMMYWKMGV